MSSERGIFEDLIRFFTIRNETFLPKRDKFFAKIVDRTANFGNLIHRADYFSQLNVRALI